MDKKIILAVAGAGKTTHIINQLDLHKRSLIITYTLNNIENLRNGIINKFGYFPFNIKLVSYFTFLHSFCYKPFLADKIQSKGIYWNRPPEFTFTLRRDNLKYYLTKSKRLYHNRIAKLLEEQGVLDDITKRLEKYYDNLYIDEIQDFSSHDFNFLNCISKSNITQRYVGDFFQHTFDTSSDGNVTLGLHDNYEQYVDKFEVMGIISDKDTLKNSYRCSSTICQFIRDKIGINIYPVKERESQIAVLSNQNEADDIFFNKNMVKLFYQEHHKYNCYSQNWGSSKGQNKYNDVCVVLNKTTLKKFNTNSLKTLPPQTKNKLYVACSRTKNNLFFVSEEYYKKYKN